MAKDYADVLNGTFGDETTVPVGALSYIFGGGVRLLDDEKSQEERRIVVYPCTTDPEMTELAQGLMCVLAWELNALDGVTAIPLLTRNATGEWNALDSAFTPETFTLEGLGEDTVLTAALKRDAAGFTMSVMATTDIEDIDDFVVELQAPTEDDLVGMVLKAAARFGEWLHDDMNEAIGVRQVITTFTNSSEWLIAAFAWQRAALADAIREKSMDLNASAFRHLTSAAASQPALNSLITKGIALSMIWFQQVDSTSLLATLNTLPGWQESASAVSHALIEQGKTREAIEIIDLAVDAAPEVALNWLVLSRLYVAVQQPGLAIETLQAALERHHDYAPLLMQYGDVLMTYADQAIPIEEVVLIDEGLEPAAAFEAIAAYEETIQLLKGEQQAVAYLQLISALARYHPDRLWLAFEALALSDAGGAYTELALNAVAAQEEMDNAVSSLDRAAQANPKSSRVWRNLAYAHYLAGNEAGAITAIQEALKRATDTRSRGEYELLSVYVQDATVEAELAEIADNLSAGGEVNDRTLELLEWIVTEAPNYIEGYLLLGRAYDAVDESATALEVLLDAEKNLGADADIYVAIIDLLLDAGEETVALDYVSKALDAFPRQVPLLARAALVTDALGDREGAKAFLRQAHNIVPFHREIMRVTGIFRASEDE